jgi:hypothetical protein
MWRPVLAGWWRQHELFDGTYDFSDLCEANAVLDWQAAERAAQAAHKNSGVPT